LAKGNWQKDFAVALLEASPPLVADFLFEILPSITKGGIQGDLKALLFSPPKPVRNYIASC
jgi:hypothetical protein